jgi:hypothetical protein
VIKSVAEIGKKMDALGLWDLLEPFNFAVKPRGTVFPYFCTVFKDRNPRIKMRFLMLEGWQTLHDFVRTRCDNSFGFYSTPSEMPHFELVVFSDSEAKLFRHDTGYQPREVEGPSLELALKILWEAYGVMLRVEVDNKLPLKFADSRAIFARVERAPLEWSDEPLVIPDPPPHVEKISFPKADLRAAKDIPIDANEAVEVDFSIVPGLATKEQRPRSVYSLTLADAKTGIAFHESRVSIAPGGSLRGVWEEMPSQVLKALIQRSRIPGALKVRSARVFRMLRPLCIELPFKLSLHDKFDHLPPGQSGAKPTS